MWTSRKPPFEWVPPISLHLEGYRSNQQIAALKLSRRKTSFQFGPSFPSLVAPSLTFDMFNTFCAPNPFSVLPPLIFSACMLRRIWGWEQWLEIRMGDGIGDYKGQQKIKCRWVKRILFNISETWTDATYGSDRSSQTASTRRKRWKSWMRRKAWKETEMGEGAKQMEGNMKREKDQRKNTGLRWTSARSSGKSFAK